MCFFGTFSTCFVKLIISLSGVMLLKGLCSSIEVSLLDYPRPSCILINLRWQAANFFSSCTKFLSCLIVCCHFLSFSRGSFLLELFNLRAYLGLPKKEKRYQQFFSRVIKSQNLDHHQLKRNPASISNKE
jgi:hypothetical protein